jgi:hypothetical protein
LKLFFPLFSFYFSAVCKKTTDRVNGWMSNPDNNCLEPIQFSTASLG